jgi:hypothetical protein
MNSKKNFTVTNPPFTFKLVLFLLGIILILDLAFTIFSPPPHTAMHVVFTIFFYIPGTIVAMWTKMFRVKVNGMNISVCKRFGLVSFSFDVSDITFVEWRIVDSHFGRNEIIDAHTSKGEIVTIETLMVNSDKMIKFLEENVEEYKIRKMYQSLIE